MSRFTSLQHDDGLVAFRLCHQQISSFPNIIHAWSSTLGLEAVSGIVNRGNQRYCTFVIFRAYFYLMKNAC